MPDYSEHEPALADMLDLDGDVLHDYLAAAMRWVRGAARPHHRRRIVDLGAGTGTGTIALAQRFAGAEIVAVDAVEPMLQRIRAKALDLGLAQRVRTVRADLDEGWPALDPADVVWASLSLHHVADPDRVLAEVHAAIRPGGLIAVAEIGEPLRFLPDDVGVGRPGLESRFLEASREAHAEALPTLGTDWAPRLQRAGFTDVDAREFHVDVRAPYPAGMRRYATLWLHRLRAAGVGRLGEDDLAALDTLLGDGPNSVGRRDDLRITGSRTVLLARR
jgi:SAM-dependent methyltransferase